MTTLEQYVEPLEGKIISKVSFQTFSPVDIEKMSLIECQTPGIFEVVNGEKVPKDSGIMDLRLGVSSMIFTCKTCDKSMADCPGHLGYIDLKEPCFNIGYISIIIKLLQILCKNCSELLLNEDMKQKLLASGVTSVNILRRKKALFISVNKEAKKTKICSYCGFYNGPVKKIYGQKIIHEYYKVNSTTKAIKSLTESNIENLKKETFFAQEFNPELKNHLMKIQEILTPSKVLLIFNNVPLKYFPIFCMGGPFPQLSSLLFQKLLVPPPCIRPSVFSDTQAGSNEDDLTLKLESIIWANHSIADHERQGSSSILMLEDLDYLQSYTSLFINGECSGLPPHLTDMSSNRGCIQRLKGKYGRFRGNLSGKRVDFSSRTVISPDPNVKVDQVAIPRLVAMVMTYPEMVSNSSIERLRKLVRNGADTHPGANYVIHRSTLMKQFLRFGDRNKIAENLKPGDIVERHMIDGDIVLFNRQPSLHRLSIMAHKVVVKENRTFRFNECACTPYNADFDGDEMNIHLPQTEEARAEALTLMGVQQNIITPRNGEPLIAATQDFITGSYILTRKDTFLRQDEFCRLLNSILSYEDSGKRLRLPIPAILKPIKLWTGKQLISAIVNPFIRSGIFFNLETKNKSYFKDELMCPKDGFVIFYNGELMCGLLDKSIVGSGSKNTMFYKILREYGSQECCDVMWRLARVTPLFLMNSGFSIGIQDVTPSTNLLKNLDTLVDTGYKVCENFIIDCQNGQLQVQPGCTQEETLEAVILRELSNIRDSAGNICLKELHPKNSPLIMAICGSKGSFINISQMVACVGQQALNGKRTPDGFENRTLPHFKKFQKTPDAKGFVKQSFYGGLSPTEFYFHTMAGREGLVDTAVKTAETGYMQRRLVKCLEDLCVQYDDTVRSSVNEVVQFTYGDDGLDPIEMEGSSMPVNFEASYNHVLNLHSYSRKTQKSLTKPQILRFLDLFMNKIRIDKNHLQFFNSMKEFILKKVQVMDKYQKEIVKLTNKDFRIESITLKQLSEFLKCCYRKHRHSRIEPGTAVGALCAQSIGEPGTQMTLKTFHFAGVATMNITLGVPRLKEIINASSNISTPIITAPLLDNLDLASARMVKGRIEKTTLGQICEFIEEIYLPNVCYLLVKLDISRIKLLRLEIDEENIQMAIAQDSKLKIKMEEITILAKGVLAVIPTPKQNSSKYFVMQHLKVILSNVVVKGYASINKAIIHFDEGGSEAKYKLLIEGEDLRSVISTKGIDGTKVTSNHTHAVFQTLGIEAARSTIINEIVYTMSSHGMSVDTRHVMLLADLMTYKGEVLGITRYGLNKMKESVLMLASFEKTSDHLFDAAYFGAKDDISGVSESIIMGRPMKLGTGIFKLIYKTEQFQNNHVKKSLFENSYLVKV